MPLQNRVHPDGTVMAVPQRGGLMGNRGGRIHDDAQQLGRARWRSRQWITCVLSFKDRQRRVMGRSYTELFFLDEVTALAAGHRPCFECRRADALRFACCFPGTGRATAKDMDRILHQARLGPKDHGRLTDQPVGTVARAGTAVLALHSCGVLRWSFEGYARANAPDGPIELLTPAPMRATLSAGYVPAWHPSAAVF